MEYIANENRYASHMKYSLCGRSGLALPKISLGFWHNFGENDDYARCKEIVHFAFDNGITCFDLANNYGPPPSAGELTFGKIYKESLVPYRDEIIVTTKAGHLMWNGPYGDGSSRKNLMASLDQSLKRMQLDYVDIFYSHRYDGITPLEETIQTLIDIVKSGKALYAGLSKYPPQLAEKAYQMMEANGVHCLIHQDRYNLISKKVEDGTLQTANANGVGFCAFSPLAQGILTNRYINGIPENSRASRDGFLKKAQISDNNISVIKQLNAFAQKRGESLAQMSLSWVFKDPRVTTVIVGASSVKQLADNLGALSAPNFSPEELSELQAISNGFEL